VDKGKAGGKEAVKLRSYTEYRESGAEWLGKIPAHWKTRRIKYILREKDSRSTDGKEQLLRVSQYTGVTQRIRADGLDEPDTRADSLVGYKKVQPDDLVINIMLAWNGSLGVSRYSGIASPAYCVYRFGPDAHPWYFHHLLRSPTYKARIKAVSTGVVESRLRLYSDDLYRIEALLPPPEEQTAIVRFLDHAHRRMDKAIRAKRKLIALLNEQKQAIIHRAVTRGLDPNAPLKDSGIPWLGKIPAHWKISRLKFVASHIVDCLHATPHYISDGEFPAIRTADIEPGKVRLAQARRVSKSQFRLWTGRLAPREDDILYSREGERYGIAALVPQGVELCISQRMMAFRIREAHQSEFIMWQLNCPHIYAQASVYIIGSTSPHVNIEQIKNYRIIVPPKSEQERISKWIRTHSDKLDTIIARTEREITLLREYQTRLTADVVTGKLDVREAARRLPEDGGEPAEAEVLSEGAEPDEDFADESGSAD
jgi:type I restriction enzyme S subunit